MIEVAGVPIGKAARAVWNRRPASVADGLFWLGAAADALDTYLQRLSNTLAQALGCDVALLLMLPLGLLLRPVLSLMRSVQHSWWLGVTCLLIVSIGIAAGPLVGTRAGLVLVPIYVLGWTCSLKSVYMAETAQLARSRLARAGRKLRERFVLVRAHVTPDQRN